MAAHFSILAWKILWTEEPCSIKPMTLQFLAVHLGFLSPPSRVMVEQGFTLLQELCVDARLHETVSSCHTPALCLGFLQRASGEGVTTSPPCQGSLPSCAVGMCMCVLLAQWCPTLCDPMDCSPPGSSVHEISQARILEWAAIPFSRGSSRPRDQTQVSWIAGRFFTVRDTRKAPGMCIVRCYLVLQKL